MLLLDTKQNFESKGLNAPKEYKVKVGPKLFKTMFARLYDDPIRAVIREISTNAWEIHKQLGKENIPFSVKLPNWSDCNFTVRDYGSGLSEEQFDGLYTTAFDSTKDQSNDLGGAFGLGSKSPFAYADTFIVISYYNGIKYTYFMVTNEDGCPGYTLADKTNTSEPNGLEVTIAVKKEDISRFASTASDIYRWFANKPKVTGSPYYKEQTISQPLIAGDGWAYYKDSTYGNNHRAIAVMANVAYDLSSYPGDKKYLIDGMVLYFGIGEVSPNPSRESISFDKETVENVKQKLIEVEKAVQVEAEAKIAKCKNLWEACKEANQLGGIFSLSKIFYKGHDVRKDIEFPPGKTIHVLGKTKGSFSECKSINVSHFHPVCYVDDLAKGGITRAKNQLTGYPKMAYYCKYGEDVKEFKELLKIEDDQIVLTSTLPKITRSQSSTRNIHKTKVLKLINSSYSATHCWDDVVVDLEKDKGYYVEIKNNRFIFGGKDYHPQSLYNLSKKFGITIYGIKSSIIKNIGQGWIQPFDYLKQEGIKFISNNKSIMDMYETENSLDVVYFKRNMEIISKKLDAQNDAKVFYKKIEDLSKQNYSNNIVRHDVCVLTPILVDLFGIQAYYGVEDKTYEKEAEVLNKKYPLLFNSMNETFAKEMHYYVNRISEKGR